MRTWANVGMVEQRAVSGLGPRSSLAGSQGLPASPELHSPVRSHEREVTAALENNHIRAIRPFMYENFFTFPLEW